MFIIIYSVFEGNRFYKQIYLKRSQLRFQEKDRVPPIPPEYIFGWAVSIYSITELDILRMVGLDGYMLLRYHTICFKLALFMSFWGFLILVPIYSYSGGESSWDRYTLSSVNNTKTNIKPCLWSASIMAWIFSAYFCQLLYAEYSNFSVRRLQYLLQSYQSSRLGDPDTPPQKYFTVMVERIPAHLRSSTALSNFFENLFPGEVLYVECAMDLRDLDHLNKQRNQVRNHLEKAIACFHATGERPTVYIKTSKESSFPDDTLGMAAECTTVSARLQKLLAPQLYGYEKLDSINYNTMRLQEMNAKMEELQNNNFEYRRKTDRALISRLQKRYDTRAFAVLQNIKEKSKVGLNMMRKARPQEQLQALLFGPAVEDYDQMADCELRKVQLEKEQGPPGNDPEVADTRKRSDSVDVPLNPLHKFLSETTPRAASRSMSKYQPCSAEDIDELPTSAARPKVLEQQRSSEDDQAFRSGKRKSGSIRLLTAPAFSAELDHANQMAEQAVETAWEQTKWAGSGALRGVIELERALEILTFGAYYKYSSTAFVTFKSRITESVSSQMQLTHDTMQISPAPNPHDVIWDNVSIPKSQIEMRNFTVNILLTLGSLFWSSLFYSVNDLGVYLKLSPFAQGYLSVVIMLFFLIILPQLFDYIARYYEGMKLESEIQNTIMQRYFYFQLVNIYVTVGFGTKNISSQLIAILNQPHILIDILGKSVPSVSLYFCSLVIVKIFAAVPMEMVRPWQLSSIMTMFFCMNKKKCTRRELRTGAFYAWPMVYGWVYPQLMMVLMIQVTYGCIAPLLMPLCCLFFIFSYAMYKYQLLYVYINDYQSGGFMWYAVFGRSLVALLFASFSLLGYLSLELHRTWYAGAFYFLLPLPICIILFWRYTEGKFKNKSMMLPLAFAKELDHFNEELRKTGQPVPHDEFDPHCYMQPTLKQKAVYPEPYRVNREYEAMQEEVAAGSNLPNHDSSTTHSRKKGKGKGSISINMYNIDDEREDDVKLLKHYFEKVVIPLAKEVHREISV